MNKTLLVIMLLALLAAGCVASGANKPAATPNITPAPIAPGVKGQVVPRQSVDLALNASGAVAQVLVSEGSQVKAGDPLVQLDNARLKLAVEDARLKLQQAQLDLDNASKPADPLDLAAAAQALEAAQVALVNAGGTYSSTLQQAQSAVRNTDLAVQQAQRERDKLLQYKSWGVDVEQELRDNRAKLDNLRTDLAIAQRDVAGTGPRASQSLAEKQQAVAQAWAKYNALKKQPDPDSVQAAQLAVEAAQLALQRAEANLRVSTLVAPFAGAVVQVNIKAGQQAAPGATLLTLADTGVWYVETDNLTELTVVGLTVGDRVNVSFEAAPDLKLGGRVERIALRSQDKRGEVTYTVRVALDGADPRLRWGMTAFVEVPRQ